MQNSNKKSTWILIAVILAVLIVGIWYASSRSTGRHLTGTDPVIILQSPNGRETLTIGEYIPVTFDIPGEVKNDQFVAISIEPGAAPVALITATTTQFALKLPESILIGGDALAPLEPGKYKLRLTLYQGRPCLGTCIASSTMLGYDETDSEVTIVKAATSTVMSTSTATYTTDKYGFSFKYPSSWSLVKDLTAASSDYLPIWKSGASSLQRSFVAIYPTDNRQDFSARVDVYNQSLATVKQENKFIQGKTQTQDTVNAIVWTKLGANDYLMESNGQTYHVSGQSDLIKIVLADFKLLNN